MENQRETFLLMIRQKQTHCLLFLFLAKMPNVTPELHEKHFLEPYYFITYCFQQCMFDLFLRMYFKSLAL